LRDFNEVTEMFELSESEGDETFAEEAEQFLGRLETTYNSLRIIEFLSDDMDKGDAFITVHAGAGGTEACDWAGMLLRMYTRYCEKKGYTVELVDMLEAEGGVKSATLQVSGEFAYGYLKGEAGVHRLVRISPFDANKRRHTSFTSVFVYPIFDDDIDVEVRPEDLRVDTYRAQGAGGQHVNKTESAVRFTHLPTGIVVACQNERSQHKNRATAMKMLKAKLYEYYKNEREKENEKYSGDKKEISWGNQIRSYVFQPYTMVKDARTKVETSNIQGVMDGNLDPFIEEYLRFLWAGSK